MEPTPNNFFFIVKLILDPMLLSVTEEFERYSNKLLMMAKL